MDSLHDIFLTCEATMHIPAIPANNWQPYAPGTEQPLLQQVSYPDPTWRSSESRIQGFGTVGAHGGDMSKRIAPNHNGFYPLERNSTRPSPFMDWQTEDPSISMFIRRSPFAPLDHPSGLTTTFPVLSNIASMNFPPSTVEIDAKQPLFPWSTSEAMANSAAIHLGQTNFKDTIIGHNLDDLMRYDWSQQAHGGLTKREDGYPSSTLFDLWTLEPFSRAAETQASTHIVRSGSRYVCGICSKSHTRPSRAIACENSHVGYQPFVCDGTCGNSTCRASYANNEHLRNHKLPYSKTHAVCKICGKQGWRRNAERHLRSCLNRHNPEINGQD